MKIFYLFLFFFCSFLGVFAHPMPNSMVVLKVNEKNISGEIQLPLGELQSAIGMGVDDNSEHLIDRLGDSLRIYLMKHIRPKTFDGKLWQVEIGSMKVAKTESSASGIYKELIVNFLITPPQHYDLRNFYFDYDVIIHQVASHQILVNIKQDWQQGIINEDSKLQQIGVITLDIPSGKVPVFQVSLQQGSTWQGFKNMVSLGISHIAEGTDHILFVLTLLLPAMLLAEERRWGKYIGLKASLLGLFKTVSAFTIGHSLTLILGSIQWLSFPTKPIEILITITILISAFHAYKPIYPKKEMLLAGSFGLIHGLAFSETLKNLELSTKQMVLSILGFNIGIELMQLVVILLIFPILVLLSKTSYYSIIRKIGAMVMMTMALFWLFERF